MPSTDKHGTTCYTLCEAIEQIASHLETLALFVKDNALEPEPSKLSVERLIQFVDMASGSLRENGHLFGSEVVVCNGCEYSNAHRAVFGQATLFLDQLWFHLDADGHARFRKQAIESADSAALGKLTNGKGLNTALIVEHWDRAKPLFAELLSPAWLETFSPLRVRLEIERDKLKSQQADSGSRRSNEAEQSGCDDKKDIPAEYREGGKPDGEPLTTNYVSRPETYNLQGWQLSRQELDTKKLGRQNVYRFSDVARLSAAKNLAENAGH